MAKKSIARHYLGWLTLLLLLWILYGKIAIILLFRELPDEYSVPLFIAALEHEGPEKALAVSSLSTTICASSSVPPLTELLDSEKVNTRREAAKILYFVSRWRIRSDQGRKRMQDACNRAFRNAFDSQDSFVRVFAARAYWQLNKDLTPVLSILKSEVAHPDEDVVVAAIDGLGELGPLARDSLSELRAAVQSPADWVAAHARDAIRAVTEPVKLEN